MSRPATGTIKWRRNAEPPHRLQWHVRVSLKSGARPWVPLDPSIAQDDIAGARRCAEETSAWARANGVVAGSVKETVSEYAKRWLASREGRVRSNDDNASHLEHHILPVLGSLDVRAVGRDEIELLVSKLDAKIRAGLSPKSARNVWGTCTRMFRDAAFAKPATGLRCLPVDPTHNVQGPDDAGETRALQFLFPSEFQQFMACADVPRSWRRNVAIAVYLCLRDGEQRALKWPAVDLVHGVVTVAETFDRREGKVRQGTKGGTARQVPIPAPLLPLLQAMHRAAGGKGLVCDLPSLRDMARGLRRWLLRAGVDREALHEGTNVSQPLRWHDLRASGATWLAVQGRPSGEIRDILGHTQTSMTDRYMRAAGMLRGGLFGEVFPPLPDPSDLVLSGSASFRPVTIETGTFYRENKRGGRDSKTSRGRANRCDGRSAIHGESRRIVTGRHGSTWRDSRRLARLATSRAGIVRRHDGGTRARDRPGDAGRARRRGGGAGDAAPREAARERRRRGVRPLAPRDEMTRHVTLASKYTIDPY